MPTPISSGDKSDFIAVVNNAANILPYAAIVASRLEDELNTYDDVILALTWPYLFPTITQYNAFLLNLIGTLDDTELQNVGIYVSKTSNSPPATPNVIINCQYDGEVIYSASPPNVYTQLAIFGPTYIKKLTLGGGIILSNLWVGSEAIIDLADSSASGALFQSIWLKNYQNTPSAINAAVFESKIDSFNIDPGCYFGGYINYDPFASCSNPVTDLAATDITHNSAKITWTAPASAYLFVTLFFKKQSSNIWIKADDTAGSFEGATTFVFNTLSADTFYDVKVRTTCVNGGTDEADAIGFQSNSVTVVQ